MFTKEQIDIDFYHYADKQKKKKIIIMHLITYK